uniref:Uncharacterized protein n=1 Tax=Panagrolaimus sp. JU765 TaxID=591449 RepID=A0AC34QP48_9BILA
MVSLCAKVAWLTVVVIVLLIGIFLLTAFPLAVFPSLVKSQLKLENDGNGQPTTITWYWSHLPADAIYNFYMWNITNVESSWFYGEKIVVNDVGPYAWKEWETKEPTYSNDEETAYFTNDKAFDYNQTLSCEICSFEDEVWMPNLALMTTATLMAGTKNLTGTQRLLTSFGTLLLGSYPFIRVKMREALFYSYSDPLISLINSPAYKILEKLTGKPVFGFEVPQIQSIGYFPLYNHTADENYVVSTGKSDYKEVGIIKTWANSSSLGWWHSDSTNDVSGASDGTYWGGYLKKENNLKNFQSYFCRHMEMQYDGAGTVDGISTWAYKFADDTFDTSLAKNSGYAVENPLNLTFFPKYQKNQGLNNWNNSPFPPGMVEQRCFPGKSQRLPFLAMLSLPHFYGADQEVFETVGGLAPNPAKHNMGVFKIQPTVGSTVSAEFRIQFRKSQRLPFLAMLSLPHFYGADQEVFETVGGLAPNPAKHNMGVFKIQPTVGSTVSAEFRIQFSVATINEPDVISLSTMKNTIVPCFWTDVHINLKNYAKKYVRFNTKIVPTIALVLGIVLTVIFAMLAVAIIYLIARGKKTRRFKY